MRSVVRKPAALPAVPTFGQLYGLHAADDPLALKSSVALVVDQESDEVLFPRTRRPCCHRVHHQADDGLVVVEAGLPLDEKLTIGREDIDTEKNTAPACSPVPC